MKKSRIFIIAVFCISCLSVFSKAEEISAKPLKVEQSDLGGQTTIRVIKDLIPREDGYYSYDGAELNTFISPVFHTTELGLSKAVTAYIDFLEENHITVVKEKDVFSTMDVSADFPGYRIVIYSSDIGLVDWLKNRVEILYLDTTTFSLKDWNNMFISIFDTKQKYNEESPLEGYRILEIGARYIDAEYNRYTSAITYIRKEGYSPLWAVGEITRGEELPGKTKYRFGKFINEGYVPIMEYNFNYSYGRWFFGGSTYVNGYVSVFGRKE
jgi:hypothetical protein